VDAETLEMVVNLGFEREHVVDALRHQLRNKATVAYFLLLDNRRNLFGGYLGAEFEAGELPQRRGSVGDAVGSNGKGVGPRRPSQVQAHLMQQRLVAEQRWMLGSTTRMAPAEVMAEIFRVLRYMNVSWKKLGPYNLKCLYKLAAVAVHGEGGDVAHAGGVRAETGGGGEEDSAMDDGGDDECAAAAAANGGAGDAQFLQTADLDAAKIANGAPVKDIRVKFEIQVYKMKDERYMIDFQRMDGGVMTCMDAAAAMMKNLRLT
jgi:5'-AMP-activated protein kinase catalytic alpha subunit